MRSKGGRERGGETYVRWKGGRVGTLGYVRGVSEFPSSICNSSFFMGGRGRCYKFVSMLR